MSKGPQKQTTGNARHDSFLSVRDVSVRFGGIVALDGISFEARRGQVCSLIGPNGAGKTTLFNCLSRIYEPSSGLITFEGSAISRVPQHRIAQLGLGRTFQNLALFRTMTVLDNVKVGAHPLMKKGFLSHALRIGVAREEEHIDRVAREVCAQIGLSSVLEREVSSLPFGIQKRVELARALAGRPKLLMLDEPAAGLNHEEVTALKELLRSICDDFRVSVLLVEHHMNLVMAVSDFVIVLNFGKKIAEGTPEFIKSHPDVMRAYLGEANL